MRVTRLFSDKVAQPKPADKGLKGHGLRLRYLQKNNWPTLRKKSARTSSCFQDTEVLYLMLHHIDVSSIKYSSLVLREYVAEGSSFQINVFNKFYQADAVLSVLVVPPFPPSLSPPSLLYLRDVTQKISRLFLSQSFFQIPFPCLDPLRRKNDENFGPRRLCFYFFVSK